jgi:hypothetical protein
MMPTYKDDESFFNIISILKASTGKKQLTEWMLDHEPSRFRLILDREADQEFLNMKQREEIYPGIKSIAIVTNPWKRAWISYKDLLEHTRNKDYYRLDSFESFLFHTKANLKLSDIVSNVWYDFQTPLIKWVTYEKDGVLHKAEHILRLEHINEDLKPLQDYFCNSKTLDIFDPHTNYKDQYNDKMIELIAEVFKEDIEMFNYQF